MSQPHTWLAAGPIVVMSSAHKASFRECRTYFSTADFILLPMCETRLRDHAICSGNRLGAVGAKITVSEMCSFSRIRIFSSPACARSGCMTPCACRRRLILSSQMMAIKAEVLTSRQEISAFPSLSAVLSHGLRMIIICETVPWRRMLTSVAVLTQRRARDSDQLSKTDQRGRRRRLPTSCKSSPGQSSVRTPQCHTSYSISSRLHRIAYRKGALNTRLDGCNFAWRWELWIKDVDEVDVCAKATMLATRRGNTSRARVMVAPNQAPIEEREGKRQDIGRARY
ncbi:uncharacterized protein B0H18DRAFT_1031979 [Fomitopsis serialis]|uniref:uncharacterized protein n=1 Tax=Fomitopsis serialis TaxID=139415 RepID=UPI0020081435|nr:uncharacterized protein B0H18DRAFT_1031979 [Neoantrodia serialis]KAH9918283.1 hypothetical protein B0H18DRAFT_1031979 [Neoantrodia serialis]